MKVLNAWQFYGMNLDMQVTRLALWPWAVWLTCDIKAHVSFHTPHFIGSHATVDSRNSRVCHNQSAGDLQEKRKLQLARGQRTLWTPHAPSEGCKDSANPFIQQRQCCLGGGGQKALCLLRPSKSGKITGKQVLRRPGPLTSDSYEDFRLISCCWPNNHRPEAEVWDCTS